MPQSEEYKALRKEFNDCEQRRTAFQTKAAQLMDQGHVDAAENHFRLAAAENDLSVVIFGKMAWASERA